MQTYSSPTTRPTSRGASAFMPSRPFAPPAEHAESAAPPARAGHDFGAVSVSPANAPAASGPAIQLTKKKKKGGGGKQAQNPYADASSTVGTYNMDETWQAWLRVGQAAGHPAPDLTGHGSKKGGGKAEKERLKLITGQLSGWRDNLLENLQTTHGITGKDLRLGKLRSRYNI